MPSRASLPYNAADFKRYSNIGALHHRNRATASDKKSVLLASCNSSFEQTHRVILGWSKVRLELGLARSADRGSLDSFFSGLQSHWLACLLRLYSGSASQ